MNEVRIVKGFIFKYDADPADPDLKDLAGETEGCGIGVRDPDFWSNDQPVWSICGPYYRSNLHKGDTIFFVPKKWTWKKAGLNDYICTGILTIDDKIPDREAALQDNRLTADYRQRYSLDLDEHLKGDDPRTKSIRRKNIIIGSIQQSRWLGKHTRYLRSTLWNLDMESVSEKLDLRRIPALDKNQTTKLRSALLAPTI